VTIVGGDVMVANPGERGAELESGRQNWRSLLFSFHGRISRRTYVTRVFTALAAISLASILGLALLILLADSRASPWLFRPSVAVVAGLAAVLGWVSLATLAKRLHDRDRNGWLALLMVIPLANLWVYFEAFFLRGTDWENEYGAPQSGEFSNRAIAIALGLTAFMVPSFVLPSVTRGLIVQSFNLPSGSLEPTMLVGDYFFASKSKYGFSRYSFPWGLLPVEGRLFASAPERGDLVVFKFPPDNSTDYIQRLVGLPGDRVQMRSGALYINDEAVPKVRIDDFLEVLGSGRVRSVLRYRETLPNGVSYEVLDREAEGNLDNTRVFVVPEGHYFMLGDNRDNSADSRAGVGYVPFENFVGRAELIFYSTNGEARIWEVWKWFSSIRYDRIGRYID
jgi:signal peptidase I